MEGALDLPVMLVILCGLCPRLADIKSRLITDRYALPADANLNACNVSEQTWCGGTWSTIKDNLDYIQNAGFTAGESLHPRAWMCPFKLPSSLDQSRLSELSGSSNCIR